MPNYVSDGGVWHPAKEHAVLPHLAGTSKEVYDGPDRAAMEELAKAYGVDENGYPKVSTFGMPFNRDPDLINRAKQLGFVSVKEYADAVGYDAEQAKKDFESKAAVINKYEPPKRQPERQIDGGGKDLSGQGKDRYGGLGDPPELK
jgi:hypothetical protein